MSTQLLSRLTRATISTFEDLGFVLPTPEIDDEQAAVPLGWRARVAFQGPVTGWLDVRVTDRVAEELAANMLGVVSDVDTTVKRDALGEIANVVCGNVVPALGTPSDVFDLEAPVIHAIDASQDEGDDDTTTVEEDRLFLAIGLDSGRAELELHVDGEG